MAVDWNSPTWGHNPIHEDSHGSWISDRHDSYDPEADR